MLFKDVVDNIRLMLNDNVSKENISDKFKSIPKPFCKALINRIERDLVNNKINVDNPITQF